MTECLTFLFVYLLQPPAGVVVALIRATKTIARSAEGFQATRSCASPSCNCAVYWLSNPRQAPPHVLCRRAGLRRRPTLTPTVDIRKDDGRRQ
ncbi:uncharacterized protein B0H64DRAFT_379389 [Chaetomium fimeti]|uniref:Secreted protein n=1 Tax=Chaetomium fimeti TaxID=1854472 RepID=A0AAE0LW80_9PEZI|nr:hypothetical protein B0H64DRAFT_379389 [Chaetomium fimeti]